MRPTGLKTRIIVTIVLLLTTATLLCGLVITMFWQRSLVQMEADRVAAVLRVAQTSLDEQQYSKRRLLSILIGSLQTDGPLDCVALAAETEKPFLTRGACRHKEQLGAQMRKSLQIRSPLAETGGSSWAVLAPAPEYLLVTVPAPGPDPLPVLGAVSPLGPVYERIRRSQRIILVYLAVNILLITTIGFFRLVRSTIKPVEHLVSLTEQYDEEPDFHLVRAEASTEFGRLTSALNSMLQRIENDRRQLRETIASLEKANARLEQTREELVRTEKLASIGRLSAGLAHEIGNPIGIIQGYLELLQRPTLSDDDRLQFAGRAADELNRINRLIRQLLDFARSSPAGLQPLHVNRLLQDMLDLFKARRKMDHIRFRLDLRTGNDLVESSEEGLRQVLLNFLLNSVDAIEEMGADHGGEIVISSSDTTLDDGRPALAITIRDNGCGIDPEQLPTIFDPFFTTKEPGKGTGLGLSVSHTIIESLGGRIEVQSEPGKGTKSRILLPRTTGSGESTERDSVSTHGSSGSP
ncbi:MAG: hypothetical protein Kow0089_17300 [Desulfobulbaceae bacterium]